MGPQSFLRGILLHLGLSYLAKLTQPTGYPSSFNVYEVVILASYPTRPAATKISKNMIQTTTEYTKNVEGNIKNIVVRQLTTNLLIFSDTRRLTYKNFPDAMLVWFGKTNYTFIVV